jgi:hypothetical protein
MLMQIDDVYSVVLGPFKLDQFFTISSDATKPFDLYSAIQLKFSSSRAKLDQPAFSFGHDMLPIEGSLTFTVHEWCSFCRTCIRSVEHPAMAVTLFDATRFGMTHSNPSVSIFDSTHIVEASYFLATSNCVKSDLFFRQVVELDSMARLSYSSFNNFVYVAPISINLSNYNKFGAFHVPSLMISVSLREIAQSTSMHMATASGSGHASNEAEDDISGGLRCCIGKSSVSNLVSCSINSHVAEFSKCPLFHDVMKLTLKPSVVSGTHILFKIYDVNSTSGYIFPTKSAGSLKQIIGYAFAPVDGGSSSSSNDLELPLYRELPADYINMPFSALEPYRILPSELPIQVSLSYQSTIQPKHPQLITFFRVYSSFCHVMEMFLSLRNQNTQSSIQSLQMNLVEITKTIDNSLFNLRDCSIEALHHFFPILCNQILYIISGSIQILNYESETTSTEISAHNSSRLNQPRHGAELNFEYSALEEHYFFKSTLFRQRVFGEIHQGLIMWSNLACTALQSLASIFTQIEKQSKDHDLNVSASSSSMKVAF